VQQGGYANKYKTDFEFSRKIKMILSLAFLCSKNVVVEYFKLESYFKTIKNDEFIIKILHWFGENYIFSHSYSCEFNFSDKKFLWSVYENVLNDVDETTNGIEGWHRAIKTHFKYFSPSLNCFVETIRNLQVITEIVIVQIVDKKFDISFDKMNLKNCLKYKANFSVEYLFELSRYVWIKDKYKFINLYLIRANYSISTIRPLG
jgi:hypothetical protein